MSTGPSASACVLDRSTSGVKLQMPHSVLMGSIVQVRLAGEIFHGEVRYCLPNGAKFDVGIRIVELW